MNTFKLKFIIFTVIFSLFSLIPASAAKPLPLANGDKPVTLNVNIPATPGTNFQGSAGGDGFNIAHANGHVYNVFHHEFSVRINCHDELTAELCTYNGTSWPIEVSTEVGTGMYSYAFINTAETRLYVWAVDRGVSGGIQCMDLSDGSDCGYQVLTNINVEGENLIVPLEVNDYVDWGSGAVVNNQIYTAFAQSDGQTWLACFNLKRELPCSESAYRTSTLTPGVAANINSLFSGPHTISYGKYIYSDFYNFATELSVTDCWNSETLETCDGFWPVEDLNMSSWLPVLNTSGRVMALCSLGETTCIDSVTGEPVETPVHLEETSISSSLPAFIGNSVIVGKRVVTIISDSTGEGNDVFCFNYSSTDVTSCGSLELPETFFLYSLDRDPNRPTCIWINADGGDSQITNFDVLTMEPGCTGSLRTSLIQLSTKSDACDVTSWTSLAIKSPSSWDSASVSIKDENGDVLPGGESIEIDSANTPVSLKNVDFANQETPYFDFDIQGADLSEGLNVQFKWVTSTPKICKGLKELSKTKYTGTTGKIELGKSLKVSGKVAPAYCGDEIVFTLNRNPITGLAEAFDISGGKTETANWKPGNYSITATHPADIYCKTSSIASFFTLSTSLDADVKISAAGWYMNGENREDFDLEVKAKTNINGNTITTNYQGAVTWEISEQWQFKANLSGTSKMVNGVMKNGKNVVTETTCPKSPSVGTDKSKPVCYLLSVTGKMRSWDINTNSWINPQSSQFVIRLYDGGIGKKKVKGIVKNFNLADFASFNLFADVPGFDAPFLDTPVKLKTPTGKGSVK